MHGGVRGVGHSGSLRHCKAERARGRMTVFSAARTHAYIFSRCLGLSSCIYALRLDTHRMAVQRAYTQPEWASAFFFWSGLVWFGVTHTHNSHTQTTIVVTGQCLFSVCRRCYRRYGSRLRMSWRLLSRLMGLPWLCDVAPACTEHDRRQMVLLFEIESAVGVTQALC